MKKISVIENSLNESYSDIDSDCEVESSCAESYDKENNYFIINDTAIINYLYHISDIHVHNDKRHTEYEEIFEKLYAKIPKRDDILIVITGDIFHVGNIISPRALQVVKDFFRKLSYIADVILIAGNHDKKLIFDGDILDIIVSDHPRVKHIHYLKNSGAYRYGNITFGATDILDEEIFSADLIDDDSEYKIGLYHGIVHDWNDTINSIVEKFDGYDFVLLGDIHKHYYADEGKTMGYAGSLIQQHIGESMYNHGFIKWDLPNSTSMFVHIKNDYGICRIDVSNGEMDTDISDFPTKLYIRFMTTNTSAAEINAICQSIAETRTICGFVVVKSPNPEDNSKDPLIIAPKKNRFAWRYFVKK